MKKYLLIGTLIGVTGVWILYRALGDAQLRDVSFEREVVELIAGMVITMVGYMIYTYTRSLASQPKPEDLSILTKIRMEKK